MRPIYGEDMAVVSGDTENFRRECEARYVLAMPKEQRKPWLDSIGKRRGVEAQKYLEAEVIRQYRLRKGAE